MSYTIGEAIRDYGERAKALQAIAERFPDARQDELHGGTRAWISTRVKPTHFSLHAAPGPGDPSVQIHFYEEVAGVRVYDARSRHADTFIEGMDPKLRKALLLAMLDGRLE
jgi:hypothetical protein